jgi:ABC-type Fe3+ transport system substrate-binding protein
MLFEEMPREKNGIIKNNSRRNQGMIHARTRIPFARSIAAATFAAAVAGTFSAASAQVTTYTDLAALEAAAQKEGTLNLDVALIHFAAAKQFIPQGAVAQVKVPNDDLLPERLRDPDSYSHAMNQLASAIIYNNKLIDGGPATLQELTDPKWKDKLILDDPKLGSDGGYVLASMRKTLGSDEAWKAWLKGLKDNGAVITPTSGDAFQAVLRGDRPLCLCAYYDYVYNAAQGAPLGATFFNQDTSGIIVRPIVAVIAAAAQHPAMSALFVNWALSDKGGQKGMADSGRTPAVPVPGDEKVNLPDGVKAANFYEYMADYVANQKAYNEVFKEVLQ